MCPKFYVEVSVKAPLAVENFACFEGAFSAFLIAQERRRSWAW